MGTSATFWVGNPCKGGACIALFGSDTHMEHMAALAAARSAAGFRAGVRLFLGNRAASWTENRVDEAMPPNWGMPVPGTWWWHPEAGLGATDLIYFWDEDAQAAMVVQHRHGPVPLAEALAAKTNPFGERENTDFVGLAVPEFLVSVAPAARWRSYDLHRRSYADLEHGQLRPDALLRAFGPPPEDIQEMRLATEPAEAPGGALRLRRREDILANGSWKDPVADGFEVVDGHGAVLATAAHGHAACFAAAQAMVQARGDGFIPPYIMRNDAPGKAGKRFIYSVEDLLFEFPRGAVELAVLQGAETRFEVTVTAYGRTVTGSGDLLEEAMLATRRGLLANPAQRVGEAGDRVMQGMASLA